MSASQSPSGGPSTETAHETTPLLASSGENRARTNETTEAEEAQHGNVNPGGESAEEGSRARRPALAGITKTLYQLFVAATVTSTCQIVSAIALWTLQVYGNNEFGQWDYAVQGTFGAVWLASLVGLLVAIINLFSYRRSGQPISLFINIIVFGPAAWFVAAGALSAIIEKLDGFPGPNCWESRDRYSPDPGSHHDECLRWLIGYRVVVWIYLVVSMVLGFEFLALFINFFVKLHRERSQGPSSSSWSLPAGFVSFEVNVKWGSPRAQDESRSAVIQGRRDEEAGGEAQ